jgi:hypothetical protein
VAFVNAKDLLLLIVEDTGRHRRVRGCAPAGAHLGVGTRRRADAQDAWAARASGDCPRRHGTVEQRRLIDAGEIQAAGLL